MNIEGNHNRWVVWYQRHGRDELRVMQVQEYYDELDAEMAIRRSKGPGVAIKLSDAIPELLKKVEEW